MTAYLPYNLPTMQNYAYLHVLTGFCNSLGLPEIRFQYPLKTDREKELYRQALEKITVDRFQVGFSWSLVDEYEATLKKCMTITGAQPDAVFIPESILHGSIGFTVNVRFDGYTAMDKEKLLKTIFDSGIRPQMDALDFTFSFMNRNMESLGGHIDSEKLAREQRAAIARNLLFYSE